MKNCCPLLLCVCDVINFYSLKIEKYINRKEKSSKIKNCISLVLNN